MDPDVAIMYLPSLKKRNVIVRDSVRVKLSPKFNRKRLPEPHESEIDHVWNARVESNSTLWNGTKFRIESVTEDNDVVVFNIGITCYKEFIGTNWSPHAETYRQLGLENYNNSQAYMSDALGVGAFLESADGKVVFLKRGKHLAEAAGLWDIPGGHPEPQELVGKIEAHEIKLNKLSADDVVGEIFKSIVNEIICEVNVPVSSLSDPVLLGIARNTTSAGRPSAEYYIRCALNSEEIRCLYNKGTQAEADETDGIMFLSTSAISKLQKDRPDIWSQLAPSAKGCLTLYLASNDSE